MPPPQVRLQGLHSPQTPQVSLCCLTFRACERHGVCLTITHASTHTWDPEPCRDRYSPTGSKHLGASSTACSGHRSATGYSKMFIANLRCCLKEWKSQPWCDWAQSAGKSLQFRGPWGRGPASSADVCGSFLMWKKGP